MLSEFEISFIWKRTRVEKYEIVSFLNQGNYVTYIMLKNKLNDCPNTGKIGTTFSDGELYYWPQLHHRSLAPFLDIIHINEGINIYVTFDIKQTLRNFIHQHQFEYHLDCFSFKKLYIEDILWGLDYLHRKSLCLLNISDENIFIYEKENKAVIADFSCLTRIHDDAIYHFEVPSLYRAPELNEDEFLIDPIPTEIWSVGIMIIEVFFCHMVPWGLINYDSNRSQEILYKVDNKVLLSVNRGSNISKNTIDEFKHFVSLFLRKNPQDRWTAKDAATSKFMQTNKRCILDLNSAPIKNTTTHFRRDYYDSVCKQNSNIRYAKSETKNKSRMASNSIVQRTHSCSDVKNNVHPAISPRCLYMISNNPHCMANFSHCDSFKKHSKAAFKRNVSTIDSTTQTDKSLSHGEKLAKSNLICSCQMSSKHLPKPKPRTKESETSSNSLRNHRINTPNICETELISKSIVLQTGSESIYGKDNKIQTNEKQISNLSTLIYHTSMPFPKANAHHQEWLLNKSFSDSQVKSVKFNTISSDLFKLNENLKLQKPAFSNVFPKYNSYFSDQTKEFGKSLQKKYPCSCSNSKLYTTNVLQDSKIKMCVETLEPSHQANEDSNSNNDCVLKKDAVYHEDFIIMEGLDINVQQASKSQLRSVKNKQIKKNDIKNKNFFSPSSLNEYEQNSDVINYDEKDLLIKKEKSKRKKSYEKAISCKRLLSKEIISNSSQSFKSISDKIPRQQKEIMALNECTCLQCQWNSINKNFNKKSSNIETKITYCESKLSNKQKCEISKLLLKTDDNKNITDPDRNITETDISTTGKSNNLGKKKADKNKKKKKSVVHCFSLSKRN